MPSCAGVDVVTVLNRVLGVAGVVFLVGGIALGFRSVSSSGTYCGSAFRTAAGITPMTCDSALSSAGTLVTAVIAFGALLLIASIAVKWFAGRTSS